jgi:hypothetical protein
MVMYVSRKERIVDCHCKFSSKQLVIKKILLVEAGSRLQM